MHFSVAFLLVIAAVSAAPNPHPQLIPSPGGIKAGKTIGGALDMVQKSVTDLDSSVKLVKPNNTQALADVATKADGLGTTIKKAQTMIQGADQADLTGSLSIQKSAEGLSQSLSTLSTDLIAIKPTVDQAGLSPTVVMLLQQQKKSSGTLVKAVMDKVPALAQGQAQTQSQAVSDSLDRVIKEYSKPASAPAPGVAPSPAAAPPAGA